MPKLLPFRVGSKRVAQEIATRERKKGYGVSIYQRKDNTWMVYTRPKRRIREMKHVATIDSVTEMRCLKEDLRKHGASYKLVRKQHASGDPYWELYSTKKLKGWRK
jgi:hypothetical protein